MQLMCIHVTVAYVTSALSKKMKEGGRGGRGGKKMRVDKPLHET